MKHIVYLVTLCLILFNSSLLAQQSWELSGKLGDTNNKPIPYAQIKLVSLLDSSVTISDEKGEFLFAGLKSVEVVLLITHLGYKPKEISYTLEQGKSEVDLQTITLEGKALLLEEVNVETKRLIEIKEDTVQYNLSGFPLEDRELLENVLDRLPGFTTTQTGEVLFVGENIRKIQVNGQDFFGGHVANATQNLLAEIIDNIQVIDDYGEEARRTGIKLGQPQKIINLTFKKDRNKGVFGQATLGAGNNQRFLAGGAVNFFKNKHQLAVNTLHNNINLLGGNSDVTNVSPRGTIEGNNISNAVNLNYRVNPSSKFSSYVSYTHNQTNNETQSITQEQSIFQDRRLIHQQRIQTNNKESSNLLRYELEYKPSNRFFLKLTPRYHTNNSDAFSESSFSISETNNIEQNTEGSTRNNAESSNFTTGLNFQSIYNFANPKRSLSLSGNFNYRENDTQRETETITTQNTLNEVINQLNELSSPNRNSDIEASYVNPVKENGLLRLSYQRVHSERENSQSVFDLVNSSIMIDSLSDQYNYIFSQQRVGINYQYKKKKYNFLVGGFAVPFKQTATSSVESNNVSYQSVSIVPEAKFFYQLKPTSSLNLSYNVLINQPSVVHTRPVADLSNPQFPIYGNPSLRPEFRHHIMVQFSSFNLKSGHTIFANLVVMPIYNSIVTDIINVRAQSNQNTAVRETRFTNTNGLIQISSALNYSIPLNQRKIKLDLISSYNFSNNKSFVNSESGVGNNFVIRQDIACSFNSIKNLDLRLNLSYTTNTTNYPFALQDRLSTHSYSFALNGKAYLKKNTEFTVDFLQDINRGFVGISQNPTLLNLHIKYSFLKNNFLALQLSGVDIFNQNTFINRMVSGNVVNDRNANQLGRYILFSIIARLREM